LISLYKKGRTSQVEERVEKNNTMHITDAHHLPGMMMHGKKIIPFSRK
jgi:hypothetical protein